MEVDLYLNERRGTLPTQRRKVSKTMFYHVVVKGINHERIFNQQREKSYFKQIVFEHMSRFEPEIYSYCIMSNHAHLIIRAEIQILSAFMARILAEYASYYNYKHHRNGHVFQNRFSSECIENESYLWNCVRYIHLNPVKANMIKSAANYKYSSMGEYASEVLELVHENALSMFKKKFFDYNNFEEFHGVRHYETFLDISTEIAQQQEEIALRIFNEIHIKNGLKYKTQVFEEKRYREEYIRQLTQTLEISAKKAMDLYEKSKTKVKN